MPNKRASSKPVVVTPPPKPAKSVVAKGPIATRVTSSAAPPDATAVAVTNAVANLVAARAALDAVGLVTLTPAQRKDSNGRLRDGEAAAMLSILATVDAFPGLFASLADKDGGVDDELVETAPARGDIAVCTALASVLAELDALHTSVSDTMLEHAASAKDVTVAAYGIIKANAPANPKVAQAAALAIKFYGQPARQRAANLAKVARVAKAAAKKAKPASA